MGRPIDEALWDEWRRRLVRYGQWVGSITSFCRHEDIAVTSFYHWRRKLQPTDPQSRHPRLSAREPVAAKPLFLPVRIEQQEVVEIELPNGAFVRVPAQASQALEAAILAAGRVCGAEIRAC